MNISKLFFYITIFATTSVVAAPGDVAQQGVCTVSAEKNNIYIVKFKNIDNNQNKDAKLYINARSKSKEREAAHFVLMSNQESIEFYQFVTYSAKPPLSSYKTPTSEMALKNEYVPKSGSVERYITLGADIDNGVCTIQYLLTNRNGVITRKNFIVFKPN